MSQHKISGNDVLLQLSDNGTDWDVVICLTSNGITRATTEIDANTKCGPDKLPGVQTLGVSFEGQVMLDPNSGYAGLDILEGYFSAKSTIYWKMGPVSPAIGDITWDGTGFISQLDETYAQDTPGTFTGAIGVYGSINKTVAD